MSINFHIERIRISGIELNDGQQIELHERVLTSLLRFVKRQSSVSRCQIDLDNPNLAELGKFIAQHVGSVTKASGARSVS